MVLTSSCASMVRWSLPTSSTTPRFWLLPAIAASAEPTPVYPPLWGLTILNCRNQPEFGDDEAETTTGPASICRRVSPYWRQQPVSDAVQGPSLDAVTPNLESEYNN